MPRAGGLVRAESWSFFVYRWAPSMLAFLVALLLCFAASGETSLGERAVAVHAAMAEANTSSCRQDWESKFTCFELTFETKTAEKAIAAVLDVPARIRTIRCPTDITPPMAPQKRHDACTPPPGGIEGYAGFKYTGPAHHRSGQHSRAMAILRRG